MVIARANQSKLIPKFTRSSFKDSKNRSHNPVMVAGDSNSERIRAPIVSNARSGSIPLVGNNISYFASIISVWRFLKDIARVKEICRNRIDGIRSLRR